MTLISMDTSKKHSARGRYGGGGGDPPSGGGGGGRRRGHVAGMGSIRPTPGTTVIYFALYMTFSTGAGACGGGG